MPAPQKSSHYFDPDLTCLEHVFPREVCETGKWKDACWLCTDSALAFFSRRVARTPPEIDFACTFHAFASHLCLKVWTWSAHSRLSRPSQVGCVLDLWDARLAKIKSCVASKSGNQYSCVLIFVSKLTGETKLRNVPEFFANFRNIKRIVPRCTGNAKCLSLRKVVFKPRVIHLRKENWVNSPSLTQVCVVLSKRMLRIVSAFRISRIDGILVAPLSAHSSRLRYSNFCQAVVDFQTKLQTLSWEDYLGAENKETVWHLTG